MIHYEKTWGAGAACGDLTTFVGRTYEVPAVTCPACKETLAATAAASRVILLSWIGRWHPDGPDNGRRCVFENKEAALAWARNARGEYFERDHFQVLPFYFDPPPESAS